MSRLSWINPDRQYEVGVDRGVIYPLNGPGEAWNGLVSVNESPSDDESKKVYIDGQVRTHRRPREEFALTIQAFTYPESFYEDSLIQRRSATFGFSYRVKTDSGYKIHLVYNARTTPSSIIYSHDEAEPFSWDVTTKPIRIQGEKVGSHLIIDSSVAYSDAISELEDVLYGGESSSARLLLPLEIMAIFENHAILKVTDNGDGTFTVEGPDTAIEMLDSTTFQITWPSAVYVDENTYEISSL